MGGRYENIAFDNIKPYSAIGFTLTLEKTSIQKEKKNDCLIVYQKINDTLIELYLDYLLENKEVQLMQQSNIETIDFSNYFDKYEQIIYVDENGYTRKERAKCI